MSEQADRYHEYIWTAECQGCGMTKPPHMEGCEDEGKPWPEFPTSPTLTTEPRCSVVTKPCVPYALSGYEKSDATIRGRCTVHTHNVGPPWQHGKGLPTDQQPYTSCGHMPYAVSHFQDDDGTWRCKTCEELEAFNPRPHDVCATVLAATPQVGS